MKGTKGGKPSLNTLQGVRFSMVQTLLAIRRGKRDAELGLKLVAHYEKLARVIVMEREAQTGLQDISDEVLIAEIKRRAAARLGQPAESAGAEH